VTDDSDKVLPFLTWQRDYSGVSLTTAKRMRAAGAYACQRRAGRGARPCTHSNPHAFFGRKCLSQRQFRTDDGSGEVRNFVYGGRGRRHHSLR
jgi:hypothetical protein